MTFKKLALLFGVAFSPALHAQQQMGAIATPQINSTFYVGTITGFYPSIQSAVNAACATSGAAVDIPAGATPSDTIAAVTGGCTTAGIIDHRVIPAVSYAWVTSAYVAQGGGGGGGINALTGPVTASGTGSVATTIAPTGVTAGGYTLGGQVVTVNAAGQITAIGNPFAVSIATCSVCGTREVGSATTNPATFTFSYANGTPASATLNSVALTTPFTSGSIAASYCATTSGSTAFTVAATATNSQTSNASNSVTCSYRTFGGLGTAGATGATASGTNAVLVGATGTLATLGLAVNTGTFSFNPSGQYIYFLLSTSGHTFKVNTFATAFISTSVTFVNAFGISVSMTLYTSPTFYTGTYSVEVD